MSNIVIDIAAEFTGNKAFKQAETSTDKLTKGIKSLAKTLGLAFGAQQVLAYGKASIKAAAEDEKAQKQLALALKNVGLGRDAATSEGFIQKLEKEFGILDDNLRPAYQQLAVATRDTAESQKLLQLALDISASTGKDLGSVTSALSKAFLGNNTALSKLGVGISKADLKAKSFQEITAELSKTFAGSATQSANTFQGSIDKLSVASNNAKEIIGQGLIAALQGLSEEEGINDLTADIEGFATEVSKAIQAVGLLLGLLKSAPELLAKTGGPLFKLPKAFTGALFDLEKLSKFTAIGALSGLFDFLQEPVSGDSTAAGLAHLAELEAKYAKSALAGGKKLTAEELKQLKAKQLKLAIDKANLALGKGSNVFDMEKIQLAAAEKSAAEQLGKVTSQAQLLQITNDLARLEVKQSILALEEAIASKDVAAITNATNKLNADLGILGALTGQKVKLTEIESILKGILPKDLINLQNLNDAIALLKIIGAGGTGSMASHANPILSDPNASPKGFPTAAGVNAALAANSFVPIVPGTGGVMGGSSRAGDYAPSGFPGAGSTTIVNVYANTVANADELTTMIQNSIISLNKRGDLLNTAGSL
jgi:hypothetical protein